MAVGQYYGSPAIYHWTPGPPWSPQTTGSLDSGSSSFRGGSGSSAADVWAVGDQGAVWRYDGSAWQGVPIGATFAETLNAVWAKSASEVYIVGTKGTVLHWTGNYATEASSLTSAILRGVSGRASDVLAVGDNGAILYKSSGWVTHASPTNKNLNAVWCQPAGTCCYAVGDGGTVLERCK